MSLIQRLLSPIVEVRREEASALLLMFAYSFLIMTSYNIIKPLTRAQFIEDLGAENLPWVLLAAGVLIGMIMQLYTRIVRRLPPKSVIPITQVAITGILVVFWLLLQTSQSWASVAFYFLGQIMGLLLISQFWTLANDVYDPRQAKRLFGFIGGGASLGGMAGSAALAFLVESVGPNTMILASAALLLLCVFVVTSVIRVAKVGLSEIAAASEKKGVGGQEAIRLLRESRHLQVIALVIGFAAIGAGLLDQQLNMAVEEVRGGGGAEAMAAFLGEVQLYLSTAGFVIQVWLTSRIHRYLGIGFALLILPVSLGATGIVIIATGALWASAGGRILDSSLRYTVDKTTREILFLPLPSELKHQAKAFVDVTVDRFAKAGLAILLLILIQVFGLEWRQLSVVSITMVGIWIFTAIKARQGYLSSFRKTIAQQGVSPADVRLTVADLSTVETLVEELAHPDEQRVLYAIDVLDSLDKQNLITPLLLHHESAAVRARALGAFRDGRQDIVERWIPTIEKMIGDENADVRAAAIRTVASIRNEGAAASVARSLLDDHDPRIVATAAVVLASCEDEADQVAARRALSSLAADTHKTASVVRRDLAAAIRQVGDSRSHDLLIPLLHDPDTDVADEALRSVRALGATDALFAPTLVSLLGNRRLKSGARETLVSYGPSVVDVLQYFLNEPGEDVWVRRHIPATLARIPCQQSMDVLVAALNAEDSFLRFKVVTAVEKLRREQPSLEFKRDPIESLALKESRRYFNRLGLHHNLFVRANLPRDSVLAQAFEEKIERTVDRIYRLLALIYPWKDIAATRWAIERGDGKTRANALEYLDNILSGPLRHRVMPALEDLPLDEKVRRGNVLFKTRPRDVEETLLELINDDDQVVAAAAIDLVGRLEMWNLSDDIEHVLAHRSARDWYVFESASWTLAARKLSTQRRRQQWVEPLPAVSLADRMRGLPLFASVGIDELFRIVGAGHQVRHDQGAMLMREGAVPSTLHFLLDGLVVATGRRSGAREIHPPATLGFEEALDGRLMTESVKTSDRAVSLELRADQLRTLLADNTDLVQGLFRTLAERKHAKPGFIKGDGPIEIDLPRQLTPIQKVLALQKIPLFSKVSGAEMLYVAATATQVNLEKDAVLADETGPAGLGIIISGSLALTTPDGPEPVARAGPGDSVGVYETLAGLESAPQIGKLRIVVTEAGSVLQIPRDELFDLLGQRPNLLQQIFAAIFNREPAEARVSA